MNFQERSCIVLGKGNSERKVYFSAKSKMYIKKYLETRNDNNEALFVSIIKPYNRLGISGIEIAIRNLGKDANINKVHPHKVRRTMETMAIDKGMPVEQVQKLLGHIKIDTTMEYTMVNQNNVKNSHRRYGTIICKCKLVDCIYMDQEFLDKIQKDQQEFLCGEYSLGRYAWILEDVEALTEPISAKGHLNIWNYDVAKQQRGANNIKTIQLKEPERIKEGLRSLTEEFIGEYPYYSTWIQKNKATFKNGTRVVYELNDNGKTVGYMMIHFSTDKCAKINGIYVFPDYQKRGYAKESLLQVLEELKEQKYDYAYIQTRIHNKIVVHMFESLHFHVIGQNYHNIEKQSNWVAVYDLWHRRNFDEMFDLAEQLYPGFSKN